jgi:hypothetical protein
VPEIQAALGDLEATPEVTPEAAPDATAEATPAP